MSLPAKKHVQQEVEEDQTPIKSNEHAGAGVKLLPLTVTYIV